jgi:hypothetical protein
LPRGVLAGFRLARLLDDQLGDLVHPLGRTRSTLLTGFLSVLQRPAEYGSR